MSKFIRSFLNYKTYVFLILFVSIIYVGCYVSIPFILGKIVDLIFNKQIFLQILPLLLVLLLVTIAGSLGFFFVELLSSKFAFKFASDLRKQIYIKFVNLPISYIDSKEQGYLIQLINSDIEYIYQGLISSLKSYFNGIVTIILSLVFMMISNYILAFIVVVLTPIPLFVSRTVSKHTKESYKKQLKDISTLNSFSTEYIQNIKLLQSKCGESSNYNTYLELNERLYKSSQNAMLKSSFVNPTTRLVNNFVYAIVGLAGILLLIYNKDFLPLTSIGVITSMLTYTNQYSKPFNEISSVAGEISLAKSSYIKVVNLLNEPDDLDVEIDNISDKNIENIVFENMSFSYTEERPLIQNLNLNIKKGTRVAIVGPTGCGKTTLINLLMRFYDPECGDIKYGETSCFNTSKKSFRSHCAMVLQDTWIFNGTIEENIKYANNDASLDDVINATKDINTHEFILSLPFGYQTKVNNKHGLSQGEKQLITIARVILANKEILILDEATSNVDTRTELLISKALDKLLIGKTSFVIAHRLKTIVNSDLILVMDKGDIIEIGSHKELLAKKGFYYNLISSQFDTNDLN